MLEDAMSANDEVKEYLDYYLSPSLEADFAVMINGPWGAGKTHFTKEYFKERCVMAVSTDKPQASKTTFPSSWVKSLKSCRTWKSSRGSASRQTLSYLYASLYGVRSVSEITDQFFAQAHPALNSKTARLLGSAFSRVVNGYAGTEVNSGTENKSIIQEMVLKLEGRVLIFDDLERCAMPLVDVLGFVNAYVEHEGLKVIVIASEDDIPEAQRSDYLRKKEKLVGKTLRVTSEPEVVLGSFVAKLMNQSVIDAINRESGSLLRTFNASRKQNFRSLRFVLSDFERLATACDSRLQEAPEAMAKLLLFMMAAGLEHRSGDLAGEEIASLPKTLRSRMYTLKTDKEKTPAILKAEQLEATYPDVEWMDAIVPPSALAKLFETGIVDTVSINEHLASHPLVVGYTATPAWRQLWNWTDLPREQYLKARAQLVDELQKREHTHPGHILHVAGIVIQLKDFDDHLLGDENVVTFFERYIQGVRAIGRLEPARNLFDNMVSGYAGLGYVSEDSPEFHKIYAALRAATYASFADRMREVASTYVDRITKDPNAYSSLRDYGVEDGNYADAPFLHYIDPDNFVRVIIKDGSPDSRLLAILHARYEHEGYNHALGDEYPWLKALRSHLEEAAAAAQPPHKRHLERSIKYYFGKIDETVRAAERSAAASGVEDTKAIEKD
jgi:hypothetical protein